MQAQGGLARSGMERTANIMMKRLERARSQSVQMEQEFKVKGGHYAG